MLNTTTFSRHGTVAMAAHKPRKAEKAKKKSNNVGFTAKRPDEVWKCVESCGACCKLDKGPSFATPEEIFTNPVDIELYNSLIGPDGWCIHYEKATRRCSIYSDRPYFCRVEPDVFETLFDVKKKKFNKVACSSCRDTIKSIYGPHSKELDNFNRAIWEYGGVSLAESVGLIAFIIRLPQLMSDTTQQDCTLFLVDVHCGLAGNVSLRYCKTGRQKPFASPASLWTLNPSAH